MRSCFHIRVKRRIGSEINVPKISNAGLLDERTMRRFDYCFLLDLSHPSNLIGRAIGIAALKERAPYRMKKNPLVFRKLEDSAKN